MEVLPPHARRCLGELLHGFVESEVHDGYEQTVDVLGAGRQFHGMELEVPPHHRIHRLQSQPQRHSPWSC